MLVSFAALLALLCSVQAQSLKKEKDLCLSAHNALRALHVDTSSMVWDDQLASGAEQWALKLARENGLRHSRGSYGENLYMAWGQSASCARATLSWYNEIKDYDFNRGGYRSGTGHFTQIVWKGSTKLGVGIATMNGRVVIVARYSPAGNFMGRFKEHVQRQKSGARVPSLSELENGGGPQPPQPNTDGPNPPPTQVPPIPETHRPPPADCRDRSLRCRSNQWQCKRNAWIRNRCQKTCNVC